MTRSLAAYWITMALAGLFMFYCVLGVQGVTSLVLPRQQFLRLSALLQAGAFFLFFGMYTLRANWIFRMTETRGVAEYLAAVRRSLLVIVLAPVWLLLAVLFLLRWPPPGR